MSSLLWQVIGGFSYKIAHTQVAWLLSLGCQALCSNYEPSQVSQIYLFWLCFYWSESESIKSMQITSFVRWWNNKGQVMQGLYMPFDILSMCILWQIMPPYQHWNYIIFTQNSHLVVIHLDTGPTSISLLYMTLLSLQFTQINPHINDSSLDHVQPAWQRQSKHAQSSMYDSDCT